MSENAGRGSPGGRRPWYVLDHAEVESGLGTSALGLARAEAAARLERHGPNQLEEAPPPSVWAVLLHQFTSPLIYILLVATLVTLLLREYADAIVIAVVLALNALIGFVQEWQGGEVGQGADAAGLPCRRSSTLRRFL